MVCLHPGRLLREFRAFASRLRSPPHLSANKEVHKEVLTKVHKEMNKKLYKGLHKGLLEWEEVRALFFDVADRTVELDDRREETASAFRYHRHRRRHYYRFCYY